MASLGQTRTEDPISRCKSGAFAYRFPSPLDGVFVATSEIVSNTRARIEKSDQRIMGTHTNSAREVLYCRFRLPVESKGPAKIAVGGREVRI